MSGAASEPEYSIAAVSKLTGASCHVLRVWERRYGFPVPRRSPSGHRRYDPDQVHALRIITQLAQSGRHIGELISDLRVGKLVLEEPLAASPAPAIEGGIRGLVETLMAGDLSGGELNYERLTEGLGPAEILST